ncbi:hypothetical protein E2562_018148, partial [Oryza meyeriana var. granulata]
LYNLESCLFVLFPYFSYMLAEGFGLSGIISILFTGIVMKRYTFSNLSKDSQRFTASFFHLLSSLAETFVFIYMGFDIAMEHQSWSHVGFIFFSIIFILVARAANVFSCAYLLNMARPPHQKLSRQYQVALWYSGLRGAMAFALALQSVHDLPEGHGQTILTATISIVVLTVLLIGGSTSTMLEALHVVGDSNHDNNRSFEDQVNFDASNMGNIEQQSEEGTSTANRFKLKLRDLQRSAPSFTTLDRNYLTPFFTSQNGDSDDDQDPEILHGVHVKANSSCPQPADPALRRPEHVLSGAEQPVDQDPMAEINRRQWKVAEIKPSGLTPPEDMLQPCGCHAGRKSGGGN